MDAIILFVAQIVSAILTLMIVVLIANAILSWLVAFNVVNLRNRLAYSVAHFLDSVTRPILRPFQRIIPPFGGVDITPIIAILIIGGVQRILLPVFAIWLMRVVP